MVCDVRDLDQCLSRPDDNFGDLVQSCCVGSVNLGPEGFIPYALNFHNV